MSPAETRLLTVTLAAVCAWLYRAFCEPPRIRLISPEATTWYFRSLGGRQRLTRLAIILSFTAVVSLLALPADVHPDLRDLRLAASSCGQRDAPFDPPTCYALAPGGVWVVEERRADGTRLVVATVASPAFSVGCHTLGKDLYVVDEPPSASLAFHCP